MQYGNSRGTAVAAVALTAVAGLTLAGCGDGGTAGAPSGHASAARSEAHAEMHEHVGTASAPGEGLGGYDPHDADDAVFYATVLSGANEVPTKGKPPVGDKDGTAFALLRVQGDEVSFAVTWSHIGTPTMGHLHEGVAGVNHPAVKVPFFMSKLRLPDGRSYVYGTRRVTDKAMLRRLAHDPQGFYVNLHNEQYTGGAARGQVFRLPAEVSLPDVIRASSVHPVVRGEQFYTCTTKSDGSHAYVRDDVDATLTGGIRHTFEEPGPQGPPQWVARDGSGVSGTVLDTVGHGAEDLPAQIFKATPFGTPGGELSKVRLVLRADTAGGTAPKGDCDPAEQPETPVPFHADYLFLSAG